MCILLTPPRAGRITLRNALFAGVLLGLALLARSTALALPPVLGIWLFLRHRDRRSLKVAAVFVVVTYLVIAPWVVRNEFVMKTLAVSTNGGYTLWLGDNPRATGGNQVRGRHPKWALATRASEVRDNQVRTHEAVSFMLHHFTEWLSLARPKFEYLFRWKPEGIERATDAPVTNPQAPIVARVLVGTERTLVADLRSLYPIFRAMNVLWWCAGALATGAAIWRRRPAPCSSRSSTPSGYCCTSRSSTASSATC